MGILDQLMWSGGHNSVAFRAFYLMMDEDPPGIGLRGADPLRCLAGARPPQRTAPPGASPGRVLQLYRPLSDGGPLPAEDPAEQEALRIIQAAMQPHQEVENDDRDDQNNDQSDGQ